MANFLHKVLALPLLAAALLACPLSAPAQGPDLAADKLKSRAGFEQKLGGQIPLDLVFKNEKNEDVALSSLFRGKPVILILAYYECPMLCNLVLNGVVDALKKMPFHVGQEFDVVTVSFDPGEKPALAAAKKENYLKKLGQPAAADGWHFLTGEQPAIARLTQAVGFTYLYDEKTDEYGHASGIMVATPDGRLSHYLYGVVYEPSDLRLALVSASAGKIGSPVDKILLFCYHYDPATGKYGMAINNLVRVGCVATVLALGTFMTVSLRRESKQRHRESAG